VSGRQLHGVVPLISAETLPPSPHALVRVSGGIGSLV
jgi:hypothetical protein